LLFITSQPRILVLSIARTLFIPVFLACNITTASTTITDRSPLINSDVAYFTILMLFGMTNGWISSLCMITASSPALNPGIEESDKDVAGTMAGFCLVAGLAGGSVASFGVNWFVRGSLI
jgi:equilibrative nucleoside transporter 1/2/3